jgi:hypothetical protein
MLLKNLKIIALTGFALALFSSCSTDDEVFEEQEPQSLISTSLKQRIQQSTNGNTQARMFQDEIAWYQDFNPSTCNINSMLLAFELFDANGTSLNVTSIFFWEDSQGTFESFVNEQIAFFSAEYQQDVTLVFTAAILFRLSEANEVVEYAEVNSYSMFLDYFDDCQSDSVVFEPNTTGVIDWFLFEVPTPTEEVVFPDLPCLSLVFPLEILVATDNPNAEPYSVTVDEMEFASYIGGENSNITVIDFIYPVTFVSDEGTTFTVNSIDEIEQLYEQQCD